MGCDTQEHSFIQKMKKAFKMRGFHLDSDSFQFRISVVIFTIGAAYAAYLMYYGIRRLEPNPWNERKNEIDSHLRLPQVKAVHDYINEGHLPHDITIVTAYFNLGAFAKGEHNHYTPTMYMDWMTVFGRINNSIVVFADTDEVINHFRLVRQKFPKEMTHLLKVKRESLKSFTLAPSIRDIFGQKGYPVFHPNTVNENYSCVMHAKFELVQKVIQERLFHTRYVAWLDIGLFRAVVSEKQIFPIIAPPGFDETKVAYSEVHEFKQWLTPYAVIADNMDWVCGAFFMGRADVVFLLTQDYLAATEKLISQRLMSTDQQVLYIMYLPKFNFTPRVELQTYTTHSHDDWFYLGYLIKDIFDQKQRELEPLFHYFARLL